MTVQRVKIIDTTYEIENIEFDGIDHSDAPDFCDAFITSASIRKFDGEWRDATEKELDEIMEDSDFVYENLESHLY
jgi:beta-N-acetylglucosaminidase